jgi:Ribonuclease G/E
MAKVRQTVKTTKTRTRKTGGNSGYRKCNMCHGTGRIKNKK